MEDNLGGGAILERRKDADLCRPDAPVTTCDSTQGSPREELPCCREETDHELDLHERSLYVRVKTPAELICTVSVLFWASVNCELVSDARQSR